MYALQGDCMSDLCYTFLLTPLYSYLLSHWLRGNTFNPFSIISARHEVSIIYAFYCWQSLQSMQLTVVAVCARGWLIPYPSTLASSDYLRSRRREVYQKLFVSALVEIRARIISFEQGPIQFAQFNYDGWLFHQNLRRNEVRLIGQEIEIRSNSRTISWRWSYWDKLRQWKTRGNLL